MNECGPSLSYQEHAESFSHDAVEEVEGGVSRHHEEVGQEEVLPAAVVQQGVVLTAEQRLIGVLEETQRHLVMRLMSVTGLNGAVHSRFPQNEATRCQCSASFLTSIFKNPTLLSSSIQM